MALIIPSYGYFLVQVKKEEASKGGLYLPETSSVGLDKRCLRGFIYEEDSNQEPYSVIFLKDKAYQYDMHHFIVHEEGILGREVVQDEH